MKILDLEKNCPFYYAFESATNNINLTPSRAGHVNKYVRMCSIQTKVMKMAYTTTHMTLRALPHGLDIAGNFLDMPKSVHCFSFQI